MLPSLAQALKWLPLLLGTLLSAGRAAAQQSVPPPFRLPDGSYQVVAAAPLAGITAELDGLFTAAHPGTRITLRSGDNYSAMAALTFDRSLLAPLGCEYTRIGLGDNLKIAAEPIAFRLAHASLTPGAAVPMLGVIVHPGNPLRALSLAQLARIFTVGAPGGDLALWSQAGVTGPLGARVIHPFGPLTSDYLDSDDPQAGEFLATTKFGGLNMNHAYQPLAHYAEIVARVREDPAAIGIVALNQPLQGVRVLALRASDATPPIDPTPAAIASGLYPLDRFVYLYVRAPKAASPSPLALEYLRLALSDEAQQRLRSNAAGYIPLSAAELAAERGRLATYLPSEPQ